MLERRINFIINKNPQLIIALNRNKNNPLIRKYNHIPFNNILMYIADITDDNISINNCTNNDSDNNIVLEISPLLTLITIIPCGASLVCLLSFMVYTIVKPLINK